MFGGVPSQSSVNSLLIHDITTMGPSVDGTYNRYIQRKNIRGLFMLYNFLLS